MMQACNSLFGMPTQQQLDQLKRNTKAIIDWVNHMHDYLQDPLNEVYLKVGQDAQQDAAQSWVSKVNGFAFDAIGKLPFPGAGAASNVISAMFSSYNTNTAPRLDQIFGSIWSRFSANFLRANDDLGYVYSDPAGHWNDTITNPITGATFSIASLADPNVVFPTQQDDINNFNAITDATVTSFRYNLTKYVFGQRWAILHQPNSTFWSNWNDNDAQNFAKQQISGNRDVFLTWWHDQNGSCAGCPNDGISTSEPRLGIGQWYSNWDYYHGDSAPRDLCDWLIQDDGFGTVYNPNAITTRRDVFYNWPIDGNLNDHPDHTERNTTVKQPVSDEDRNRAKLWRAFMTSVPRKDIEQDIIQKTVDDPKFAYDLRNNPKKTLSDYIGLEIPDCVNIEIIQEIPGNYKLVLPYIGRPNKKVVD